MARRTPGRERFTEVLLDAWTKAGPPSYNDFEKRSEEILGRSRRLSSSTTQEILTGQRSRPPRWDWVRRFWTVLRAMAADHGIDPDSLGTLDALKAMHDAMWAEQHRTRRLAGEAGSGANGQPRATPSEVLAEIRRKVGVEWWHGYEDVVPGWAGTFLSLEPAAELIHSYETVTVPGLLQTSAYAGAVLREALHTLPDTDISRLVELRMRRQLVLRQPDPPRLWAVFHEAALLQRLGDDATIMRTQIRHLIEISQLPDVTIQVIPSDARIRTLLGYPITLLRFRDPEITDVVYLEQLTSALYLHNPAQVSRYAQVLSGLSAEALPPARTIGYLSDMLGDTRAASGKSRYEQRGHSEH